MEITGTKIQKKVAIWVTCGASLLNIGKVLRVPNEAPGHEDVWRNRDVTPRFLNLNDWP
jgi:hypothetical protein